MRCVSRHLPLGLLAAVALAAPAAATRYTYVITGTTTDDVEDVYGYEGASLPVGVGFTLTYVLDDSLPAASYGYGASGSSASGGGAYNDGGVPPLAASLTIGGYSYTVRQGDLFQPYAIDSVGDPVGTQTDEQDNATATKDLASRTLTLQARYSNDQICCGVFFGYSQSSTDDLFISLRSADFASADLREVGSFALDPGSTGYFLNANQSFYRDGTVGIAYDSAGLSATRLTVTAAAVPEPAAWLLMLAGFGAVGAARRRQAGPRTS